MTNLPETCFICQNSNRTYRARHVLTRYSDDKTDLNDETIYLCSRHAKTLRWFIRTQMPRIEKQILEARKRKSILGAETNA